MPADQRAARCTGTALSVAAHLLGVCVPGSGARIMAFLGGPSTEGPGAVSLSLHFLDFKYLNNASIQFLVELPYVFKYCRLFQRACLNLYGPTRI